MDTGKRITIVACALFVMLGFVVNGVVMLRDARENSTEVLSTTALEKQHDTPYTEPEKSAPEPKEPQYIVKLHNGAIAVFAEDAASPMLVTDIPERSLRNYDRELLSRGIAVSGDSALAALLEDFGS